MYIYVYIYKQLASQQPASVGSPPWKRWRNLFKPVLVETMLGHGICANTSHR